ncbi:MAG: hypothetical protein ACLTTU_12335 [Bilophila wadsworthia]
MKFFRFAHRTIASGGTWRWRITERRAAPPGASAGDRQTRTGEHGPAPVVLRRRRARPVRRQTLRARRPYDADLDALETAITAAITADRRRQRPDRHPPRHETHHRRRGLRRLGEHPSLRNLLDGCATAAKPLRCLEFALATGARVLEVHRNQQRRHPTLDVNGTGAKPIQYRGAAIAAGTLAANRTYEFVYTGAQYELVGDVDTNTTYSLATASNDGLMAKGDKGKLDGIAVGAEVNQNAFGNILVGSTTIAADTKTDTLTFVAGTNVTLTPDAANDKLTIAAKDTTYAAATQSVAGLMSAADKKSVDYCEALRLCR